MRDIYIKFTGPEIRGGSLDKDHAGWAEVLFWNQGMKQPQSVTASTSGGHTCERCNHSEMIFVKMIDLLSPKLYEALSSGVTFSEVTVEFFRADGGDGSRVKYLEIKLKDVIIGTVSSFVMDQGLPLEEFSLKYAAIQWKYTKQKIGGNIAGNTQGAWSLAKNDKSYTV